MHGNKVIMPGSPHIIVSNFVWFYILRIDLSDRYGRRRQSIHMGHSFFIDSFCTDQLSLQEYV